jgi:hypothetical protein
MKYRSIVVTGVANSAAVPLDIYLTPFNVSMACVVSATATYTVQYTLDDLSLGTPTNWFNHATMTGLSATANGTIISPVTAVRLTVSGSTGTVTFQIAQAGVQ